MSPGRETLAELQTVYESNHHTAASGIILRRKDHFVGDGTFKWVPCLWTIKNHTLELESAKNITNSASPSPTNTKTKDDDKIVRYRIGQTTQYKKPRTKHYPLQFRLESVHTTVLLDTVTYAATGYASSPLDGGARAGTEDVKCFCKLGALELGDLEKLLKCVQAVVEGKAADAYI